MNKEIIVEIVGEINLDSISNNFYQILLDTLLNLHKQQEKSNA